MQNQIAGQIHHQVHNEILYTVHRKIMASTNQQLLNQTDPRIRHKTSMYERIQNRIQNQARYMIIFEIQKYTRHNK